MSDKDRARLAWAIFAIALAMLAVAVLGGCERNGLGGYELPKILRR
ncbi:MAG: hypothetical protein KF904_00015 [Rhodoblastus sp.]|nr:hypothetical protein [Rhodoblastus sp.]